MSQTEMIGNFDWQKFQAYRVFDEFLDRFIVQRRSYITSHDKRLDFDRALADIENRFVEGYDDSEEDFEGKVAQQFAGAPLETKIVFANAEYLWAMPVENISPAKKLSYVERWFDAEKEIRRGDKYFFGFPHIIANPGPWYLRNKYNELVAVFRLLSLISSESNVSQLKTLKDRISEICYSSIYRAIDPEERFATKVVCGVHSALLHLSNPELYESIISEGHKEKIVGVFSHIISDRPEDSCREERIKLIRERLYGRYEHELGSDAKHRWFFYSRSLKPLWVGKKLKRDQANASINDELAMEQNAEDVADEIGFGEEEGAGVESTGYRLRRSAKLVLNAKERDNYCCQACGFFFKRQIVHVHHLDPLSEREKPKKTKLEDLITLCPNCHYLAHHYLRKSHKYKSLNTLLHKLKSIK